MRKENYRLFFIFFFTVMALISGAQTLPTFTDISYVSDTLAFHKLDLYIPGGGPTLKPCVVHIHGGGWKGGSKGNAMNWTDSLYLQGYVVADINYRLSAQAIFPAQIQDCKAAIRFLKTNAQLYSIDSCKIGVIGESAGGHLAAMMGTTGAVASLEDLSQGNANVSSRVQAAVDLYGPTDFTIMDSNVPAGCTEPLVHNVPTSPESMLVGCDISLTSCYAAAQNANPINYIDAGDPPFLIRHGGADCSVAPYSSQMLHDSLTFYGVVSDLTIVPDAGHGGPFGGAAYVSQYRQFFDTYLKNSSPCVSAALNEKNNTVLPFSVYPNPAHNNITVNLPLTDFTIKILDLTGREIISIENAKGSTEIDLSAFPPGMYFLMAANKKSILTNKIPKL